MHPSDRDAALLLPVSSPPAPPVALHVAGLVKRYRAGDTSCTALDGVTLRIRPGECLIVAGDAHRGRVGPRTLLWCIAGIVRPTAGAIRWSDSAAAREPPALWLAAMSAPLPARWRVSDVLQAAVPAGTCQAAADALVSQAIDDCELHPEHVVQSLPVASRWCLQLARAGASGARWILLDLPGSTAGHSHDVARARTALVRIAARVRARGGAVIAAADGDGPLDDALSSARHLVVAAGRLRPARAWDVLRVAEADGMRSVDSLPGAS